MDNTHDSQRRSRIADYMQRFNAKIEFTAGKENLIADALSRVHKYPGRPTLEKDFIPQYIDPIPVYYTSNKLLFSDTYNSIPTTPTTSTATTMVSRGASNFRHVDCDYNKCHGREISLGHHSSCLLMDKNDQQDEGEATDGYEIIPPEPDSSTESLRDIDPNIFEVWVLTHFDPPVVSNMSLPQAEQTTQEADPNYAIKTQNATKSFQKHRMLHWAGCFDNHCFMHNKYYTKTHTIHNITWSTCGRKDHEYMRCENKAEIIKAWKMWRRWNPDVLEEGPVLSGEGSMASSNLRPMEASPIPPSTLLTVLTYLRASSSARPPLSQQDTQYQQHLRDVLHHAGFAPQQVADVLEILQCQIPKDNLLAPNTQLKRQSIQPLQTATVTTRS